MQRLSARPALGRRCLLPIRRNSTSPASGTVANGPPIEHKAGPRIARTWGGIIIPSRDELQTNPSKVFSFHDPLGFRTELSPRTGVGSFIYRPIKPQPDSVTKYPSEANLAHRGHAVVNAALLKRRAILSNINAARRNAQKFSEVGTSTNDSKNLRKRRIGTGKHSTTHGMQGPVGFELVENPIQVRPDPSLAAKRVLERKAREVKALANPRPTKKSASPNDLSTPDKYADGQPPGPATTRNYHDPVEIEAILEPQYYGEINSVDLAGILTSPTSTSNFRKGNYSKYTVSDSSQNALQPTAYPAIERMQMAFAHQKDVSLGQRRHAQAIVLAQVEAGVRRAIART